MTKLMITRLIAAVTAASIGGAAFAREAPLQVSYPTDGQLGCEALLAETTRMNEIMGVWADGMARAQGAGRAAELGASVAINGALYSGALGSVPGLGMFANAAGAAAKRKAAADAARQQEQIRTAESRRAVLTGLYQGKGCGAGVTQVSAVAAAPSGYLTTGAIDMRATASPSAASVRSSPPATRSIPPDRRTACGGKWTTRTAIAAGCLRPS